jgi:HAD superfamily hydrolase (TIGR01509 family)
LPPDFVKTFERDREDAFRAALQPVPGAAKAVQDIKAMGFDVCVATQGKPGKTELTLTLTGLRGLFGEDALFSAHSVARGKPAPDLFLDAAAKMGAEPERSTVVEDTMIGVRAALAAGMRVIAYVTDGDVEEFRAAGAQIARSLGEVPGLLA